MDKKEEIRQWLALPNMGNPLNQILLILIIWAASYIWAPYNVYLPLKVTSIALIGIILFITFIPKLEPLLTRIENFGHPKQKNSSEIARSTFSEPRSVNVHQSVNEELSSARVIAGLCSFIVPGLGQLLLDRLPGAAFCFFSLIVSWTITLTVFDSFYSTLSLLVVGLLPFTTHVVSAYYAANGHKLLNDLK